MLDRRIGRWLIKATSALILATLSSSARANVRLPHVFGDHMVLQRDMLLTFWGWADPAEKVTVSLANHSAHALADEAGRWRIKLPALSAGGPHKLVVEGKNKIEVDDVLIGEVWICSGQSNMQMSLRSTQRAGQDMPKANHPRMRLFSVPLVSAGRPQPDLKGEWAACTPLTVREFSAVAYYFGKELLDDLKVPVGLINTSWGGTAIEPWTPALGFAAFPALKAETNQITQANAQYRKDLAPYIASIDDRVKVGPQWVAQARKAAATDADLPEMPRLQPPAHQLDGSSQPTSIYNCMIHPLVGFPIRGAIWYQGESNNGQGMMYYEKMKALIHGWRTAWGQGDFPFLYVQIAPFSGYGDGKIEGIWEAQLASLAIPNTGMAVTTDIVPNVRDIHPSNKIDVAHRLALWAKAKTYGYKDLVYSGPLFKSSTREGNKIRVRFDHIGSGLTTRDGKEPNSFQIGTSEGFVNAQAKIDGDAIVVWNDSIAQPEAVRFGWSKTTNPNLMNNEKLPASPFRTDCGAFSFSLCNKFLTTKSVEISAGPHRGTIRYTLDGSVPTEQSTAYNGAIRLTGTATVSARLYGDDGRVSTIARAKYAKLEPVLWHDLRLIEGVNYQLYEGEWTTLPDFSKLAPIEEGNLDFLTLQPAGTRSTYGFRFSAYIDIPRAGEYTFYLSSDDGSKLTLNDKVIVNNDGIHPVTEMGSAKIMLQPGKYPIVVGYFQRGGDSSVSLAYEGPGISKQAVPASMLFRTEGPR